MDQLPPSPPPPTSLPKTSHHFNWALFVVAILAIGAGLLFAIQNFALKEEELVLESPVASNNTPNDWKVYRNEEYGFEVTIPKNWLARSDQFSVWFEQDGVNYQTEISPSLIINIEKTNYDNVNRWFDNEYKDRGSDRPNKSELTIGGTNALQIDDPISFGGDIYTYVLIKNDLLVEMQFLLQNENEGNKILTSFKFTEPANTSSWKTYRNEEYGFEFKLPSDWIFVNKSASSRPVLFDYASPRAQSNPLFKDYGGDLYIYIYDNPLTLSVEEYFDGKLDRGPNYFTDTTGGRETKIVDGRSAIKLYGVVGMTTTDIVIIQDGKKFIVINDASEDSVLDNLVSTFKFIN